MGGRKRAEVDKCKSWDCMVPEMPPISRLCFACPRIKSSGGATTSEHFRLANTLVSGTRGRQCTVASFAEAEFAWVRFLAEREYSRKAPINS
jgi:hypothetical protein